MNEIGRTAFADPELSELFAGEPELLAIADAITATAPKRTEGTVVAVSRRRHLPRLLSRRGRLLVAAAVLVAAVVAAPALAFSTTVREFVGLTKPSPPPFLVATITGVKVRRPRPPALATVTVTFTVGENGRRPGAGVPFGSAFSVLLASKTDPQLNASLIAAKGSDGYYSVTTLLPAGGIGSIQIGGFGNFPTGPPAVDGEFWLPVNAFRPPQ
jgi:hypothetical protein